MKKDIISFLIAIGAVLFALYILIKIFGFFFIGVSF